MYHDELVGVVNLTNRATRGVYMDEDVERVRLLGLVISLVATHARLPERLLEHLEVGVSTVTTDALRGALRPLAGGLPLTPRTS